MQVQLKSFCLTIIFWAILCSGLFGKIHLNLENLDEILCIMAFGLIILKGKVDKDAFKLISVCIMFVLYVIVTSLFSNQYRGMFLTVLDVFLFLKPVLLFVSLIHLSNNTKKKAINYLSKSSLVVMIIAFLCLPLNIVSDIFNPYDVRFNLPSYHFLFYNPGAFLNVVIICFSVLILEKRSSYNNKIIIIIIMLLMASSLRFKGFVMLFFTLSVTLYFKYNFFKIRHERPSKLTDLIPLKYLLIIGVFSAIPGWFQFQKYFLGDVTPRSFLIVNAYNLFIDNFPFGAGAGTYASAVAKMFYSPLYFNLGFDSRWGLSPSEPLFLNDSFWPIVFAQYGMIGFVLVIIMYYQLINIVIKRVNFNANYYTSLFIIIASLFLSTLGSSLLIGGIGCVYIIVISLLTVKEHE